MGHPRLKIIVHPKSSWSTLDPILHIGRGQEAHENRINDFSEKSFLGANGVFWVKIGTSS